MKIVKSLALAPKQQRKYTSRRLKEHDDSDSQEEENKDRPSHAIEYKDTQGNVTSLQPNEKFNSYGQIFKDLLKQVSVLTLNPIVSCIITYDSTRVVTVTKESDQVSFINMYCLTT